MGISFLPSSPPPFPSFLSASSFPTLSSFYLIGSHVCQTNLELSIAEDALELLIVCVLLGLWVCVTKPM